ncbi:hypothetical protein WMY93_017378 [Mugilogobius chulae]|uniref:Uncharacterized protein n=1 Tax=Mugilogobius chulae TaxID=88201 RepID=A0AAW0NNI6_9GOBI
MSREHNRKRKRSPAPCPRTTKRARRAGPRRGSARPSSSTQLQRENRPGPSTSESVPTPQQTAQSRSPLPLQTSTSALVQSVESRSPGPFSSGSSGSSVSPPRRWSRRISSAASQAPPVGQERSGGTPQEVPERQEESPGPQAPPSPLLSCSRSPRPTSSGFLPPVDVLALEDHPLVPAGWRLSAMSPLWPLSSEDPELVVLTLPRPHEFRVCVTARHLMLATPPWVQPSSVPVIQETMRDCFYHSPYSSEMCQTRGTRPDQRDQTRPDQTRGTRWENQRNLTRGTTQDQRILSRATVVNIVATEAFTQGLYGYSVDSNKALGQGRSTKFWAPDKTESKISSKVFESEMELRLSSHYIQSSSSALTYISSGGQQSCCSHRLCCRPPETTNSWGCVITCHVNRKF